MKTVSMAILTIVAGSLDHQRTKYCQVKSTSLKSVTPVGDTNPTEVL